MESSDWNGRYVATWNTAEGERGQVFGGPRGLWYAVTSLRAEGHGRLVRADNGQVIYDADAGIDLGPRCQQPGCEPDCVDPSGHFDLLTEVG